MPVLEPVGTLLLPGVPAYDDMLVFLKHFMKAPKCVPLLLRI